jgi:hypothetical protein
MRPASQFVRIEELLAHIDDWSARWGLDFSTDKSQWVLFSNKLSPFSPSRSLCLGESELEQVSHYKYLGLTFQSNGKWHEQFTAVATKTKITANLISRICSRDRPPDPSTVAALVQMVLIPQLAYALAFWRPNKSQLRALTQIIATPLRHALSLHRSASAVRVLREFAIPTASALRVRCILQPVSRALRSEKFLPSLLKEDLANHVEGQRSPIFCRSLASELSELSKLFPLAARVPLEKKLIDAVSKSAMRREWRSLSTPKGRAVKPVLERPLYITYDSKPTVSIRARLRLSSALTPKRRFIYGLAVNDRCECGMVGDTDHVLLQCPKFSKERSVCSDHLRALFPQVVMTRDIILGLPLFLRVYNCTLFSRRNCMNNACFTRANSSKRLIVVISSDLFGG